MKQLLGSFLLILSFSSFASSIEIDTFVENVSKRDCPVILNILLERTVEANRLELAAFARLSKDQNDKHGNRFLDLSNKEYELSDALKVLLADKCFIQNKLSH